jgi:hypothetical protein
MAAHIDCTFDTPIEQVYNNIKCASSSQEMLDYICYINDNCIYVDYRYFKPVGDPSIYESLLAHLINKITQILLVTPTLIIHVSLNGFSIREIDKHLHFLKRAAIILDANFPKKLSSCYIYNASSIFTQLFRILSCFVDKITLNKVKLVSKC